MDWHWLLLDLPGAPMRAVGVMASEQRFPSQSDAETWLGECWPDLVAAGVAAVVLRQGERTVYGPMSLRPGP